MEQFDPNCGFRRYECDEDGRITYFNAPTQVEWVDLDALEDGEDLDDAPTCCGIGWQDIVICECCGGVMELKEMYETAAEFEFTGQMIKVFDDWMDLNEVILP